MGSRTSFSVSQQLRLELSVKSIFLIFQPSTSYSFNNEGRPERPSSDESVILAAAAVVAREKGSSDRGGYNSSLKNQVDSICLLISRVVNINQDFFNQQY